MRGTDFRAKLTGLTLLIDCGVESDREAQQMLARVGRFNEKCQRFAVDGIQLVDPTQQAEFHQRRNANISH